jgi:hypothetical protein
MEVMVALAGLMELAVPQTVAQLSPVAMAAQLSPLVAVVQLFLVVSVVGPAANLL